MARYVGSTFENTSLVLDGNEYHNCQFRNCRITVTRGNYTLKRVSFVRCSFEFRGEADNIRKLVEGLKHQRTGAPLFDRSTEGARPHNIGA